MPKDLRRAGIWIILAHAIFNLIHGAAHEVLEIHLSAAENAIVYAVILAAPAAAAVLLWKRKLEPGFALLAASMIGSLAFAGFKHYVQMSPDHYSQIPAGAWGAVFHASGAITAALQILGAAAGIAGLRGSGIGAAEAKS